MAVTKIHPIKSTLNKALSYICNPDKTDEKILISSYGCSYETADLEFTFTLSQARQKGNNLAHHLIQSFAPGEVSYEEAHKIDRSLQIRFWAANDIVNIGLHFILKNVRPYAASCSEA